MDRSLSPNIRWNHTTIVHLQSLPSLIHKSMTQGSFGAEWSERGVSFTMKSVDVPLQMLYDNEEHDVRVLI